MTRFIHSPLLISMSLGVMLLLGACAKDETPEETYEPSVEVEANPNVDLSQYTTYDIVNPIPSATGEPPGAFHDAQTQIEDAIVAELGSKGLSRDRTAPQLLVNPLIGQQPTTGTAQFYESAYGWYWGYGYQWTVPYGYTEGSLVLDVVDRGVVDDVGDDLLVYRGAVYGLMAQDLEVIKLQIRNGVQAIFAQWPDARPAT